MFWFQALEVPESKRGVNCCQPGVNLHSPARKVDFASFAARAQGLSLVHIQLNLKHSLWDKLKTFHKMGISG
jgi:hypothetical protein